MNRARLKKSLLGMAVILALLWLNGVIYGFSFTPGQAMKRTEKDFLFGPSEIVSVESLPGEKIFLGKFEDYISCYRIQRQAWIYWQDRGHYWGENIPEVPVCFYSCWHKQGEEAMEVILFGMVNDSEIVKIELEASENLTLEKTSFYDGLFLFHYQNESPPVDSYSQCFKTLKAYDEKGTLVYETDMDSESLL